MFYGIAKSIAANWRRQKACQTDVNTDKYVVRFIEVCAKEIAKIIHISSPLSASTWKPIECVWCRHTHTHPDRIYNFDVWCMFNRRLSSFFFFLFLNSLLTFHFSSHTSWLCYYIDTECILVLYVHNCWRARQPYCVCLRAHRLVR